MFVDLFEITTLNLRNEQESEKESEKLKKKLENFFLFGFGEIRFMRYAFIFDFLLLPSFLFHALTTNKRLGAAKIMSCGNFFLFIHFYLFLALLVVAIFLCFKSIRAMRFGYRIEKGGSEMEILINKYN